MNFYPLQYNCLSRQVKELVEYCDHIRIPRPAVVQNECHPYLTAGPIRQEGLCLQ